MDGVDISCASIRLGGLTEGIANDANSHQRIWGYSVGRHSKTVMSIAAIDRREIGYYSTPAFVAEFIAKRILELRPQTKFIFDPCVGQGELTAPFKARGCHTTGYDIVDMARQGCD
ncbi:MAG TPA: hypothetical protein VMI56_07455, partial [Reyranella sp.]|nr:hypothetical protein [Reyranella sp.]